MIAHIVAIPTNKDLEYLNSLRLYIYENDFRFSNKSSVSDTHITLSEISLEPKYNLKSIKQSLQSKRVLQYQKRWTLTKEDKTNYRVISHIHGCLKFSPRPVSRIERITNGVRLITMMNI